MTLFISTACLQERYRVYGLLASSVHSSRIAHGGDEWFITVVSGK